MTFASWVNGIVGAISSIVVPLIFTLAAASFLWGVFNYFILNAGNEEKRAEGRQFVVWGLLGLVVLFAVWGIVNILLSTFGIASGPA